ncbi:hypothetical protein RI129_011462 [Pyrocoelia pectoralis]|uniref:Intraflagellar transport protein 88 homolog n=1 Tax=Pyrocoelia pectoralis TaxID=417401 RepID=A0AAN7V8X6_9COLE
MLKMEEEDLQSLFKKPSNTHDGPISKEETFRRMLATADASPYRPITGFRPNTGSDVNRPMTAVRGAGYSSQNKVFDPLNQGYSYTLELPKDESPEEKVRVQERKIMQLVEESCVAHNEGNFRQALDKAKEASNKERNLIRMQEQVGLGDSHNMDLTYTVLFTLANQYATNELYTEALNTYQLIIKNRMFSNAHRLKINMGNIYYKQGQYQQAIKMYRMALDQIMHNIGMVFVRMGQWDEAVASLEYIMNEQASHRAGLHLILCCIALEDVDRMKNAFNLLLSVPLDLEDDEKYNHVQEDANDRLLAGAIRNDDLHSYEKKARADAEFCVLTAAKLIAPLIENSFSEGYDWCVSIVKNSEYVRLAGDLEINKAVMFLKQRQVSDAIDTLKSYGNESNIGSNAAINLSFIYFQQKDYDNAEKYGQIVKSIDNYNAAGFVHLGACFMVKNELEQAKSYFMSALDLDPSCFEALYNLGLVLKQQGHYDDALECFQKFSGSLSLIPEIIYQTACIFEGLGDFEAASDAYQQLLGLVPTDANILQKLGELHDHEGDKQQAHHYHLESFRYNPSNLSVIEWLGSYYIEMQVVEKALLYFEKAKLMQPNEAKWHMMVAGCHRRTGNLHKALKLYQEIHTRFPDNTECLKFLIRLCNDLGLRESQDYILELKKLEKSKEVRDRVGSSRPGSRRTNSGLSSRAGSGFSPVPEHVRLPTPFEPGNRSGSLRSSRLNQLHNSAGSTDSGFVQPVDASYSDPLGPLPVRPRTGAGKPIDFEDFGDEQLGDDLLPQ